MTLEGKLAWRNKWQLQAGFTLQNAKYKDARSWDDGGVAEEKRMFRTPDTYGYFTMTYTPIKPLNIALSGTYIGSLVEHHSGYIETNRTEKTKKFMDLGFKASYDFNLYKNTALQLNAGLQNIFNAYQSGFDKGADRDSGYIRPRYAMFVFCRGKAELLMFTIQTSLSVCKSLNNNDM